MRRYPSPSLVVSITALVVALGGAGYSATGGNFILGASNTATTRTSLMVNLDGRTLGLSNTNTGAAATALELFVAPGRPPFTVDSATKVANLNADSLDGLDSRQFARTTLVSYNLAAGANSAPITLPVVNRPVLVMGVNTTSGRAGVGQATLLQTAVKPAIAWTGLESPAPSTITWGFSGIAGTHIVYLDSPHQLDIEVNSPTSIRIHNGSTVAQTGTVTFIW